MAGAYGTFGSFILFKEILDNELGHLYRAGEFSAKGVQRTVWLWVFDGAAVPSAEVIASFAPARKVAKLLQAANVASGVVYLDRDGVPAMAWDYTAGQPLATLLTRVRDEGFPVAVDNALLIVEKLAMGLSAGLVVDIGGKPMAHGFLHPGLAVVTNDGEAIVSGFGIAEQLLGLVDDPQAAAKITPYLAPEIILNRSADKRGDVYSLGAILYQLLTGAALPADPDARKAALDGATMADDDEPIPNDIKALLAQATAARIEDRFSSSADFKKELDKLLYGGSYSPTTFNLALFMDRLFRTDIESTVKERAAEAEIDVQPYVAPEPEPEPFEEIVQRPPGDGKGRVYGIVAAVAVVIIAVAFFFLGGRQSGPPAPTPEELASQRAAQEERIREMAARMVEETMQAKEAEIMAELEERQQRIETLQKQLEGSQKRSVTAEDRAQQQQLQRQIDAEREQQRARQAALEEEKQRLIKEATAEAEEEAKKKAESAPEAEVASILEPTPEATRATAAMATARPATPDPAAPAVVVRENQFFEPTDVDTRPEIIREVPVSWSRAAMRSQRKGVVILQATVNADGTVEDVKILRADEAGFGIPESVSDAVRKYRFKPGMKDGVKIKTYATVTQRYVFAR